MKLLITGGAGFIGSHLAERLLEQGHDVTVLDNLSSGSRDNVPRKAEFVKADLKDREAIDEALDSSFDRVYHLAAERDVRTQNQDRTVDLQENVVATHNLLEAMTRNDVDELVFTSSSVVYGEAEEFPTPEDYAPMEPISLYGATKLAAENLISAYCHSFGLDANIFRLANVIGARSDHGVIYDFVQKLQDDPSELEVLGNGKQQKSYLHIEDCLDAMLQVDDSLEGFNVFNVGNDDWVSVSRIAEIVIDEFGADATINYTGGEKGWTGDVPKMMLAIDRLEETGWSPSRTSEEAVRETASGLVTEKG